MPSLELHASLQKKHYSTLPSIMRQILCETYELIEFIFFLVPRNALVVVASNRERTNKSFYSSGYGLTSFRKTSCTGGLKF